MRRWTPQEKKKLEYTKDHVAIAHNSVHAFRKNWPRKKARANRAYRREVHGLLVGVRARQEDDFPDDGHPAVVRREPVRKWHWVRPNGEIIKSRLARRVTAPVDNFIGSDYNASDDRERFVTFLASRVGGCTETSRELALYLADLMDVPHKFKLQAQQYWWARKYHWIRAFFHDEPEWEERVRAWISSFEEK